MILTSIHVFPVFPLHTSQDAEWMRSAFGSEHAYMVVRLGWYYNSIPVYSKTALRWILDPERVLERSVEPAAIPKMQPRILRDTAA